MTGLPIAFLNPLLLFGLLALPALWWLLRFLPPRPSVIDLPTAHFLKNLVSAAVMQARPPLWLVLLRCAILAALILGFANPVLHPAAAVGNSAPLRIIFDNGWASAQVWDLEMVKAEDILRGAERSNRMVDLVFTAEPPAPSSPSALIQPVDALNRLRAARPRPWQSRIVKPFSAMDTVWIASGLEDAATGKALSEATSLLIYRPSLNRLPVLLRPPSDDRADGFPVIEAVPGSGDRAFDIEATFSARPNGGTASARLRRGVNTVNDDSKNPDLSGNAVSGAERWRADGIKGAGGVYIGENSGNRLIGYAAQASADANDKYQNAEFYLAKATEPFARLIKGRIRELIDRQCGVIVLADIAGPALDDASRLDAWVARGGVLLRFGGPAMAAQDNPLIPVALQTGMRSLSGELSGSRAQKLAAFPPETPFAGDNAPDIVVERQLLATPAPDLDNHVWARLEDGTPFITAKAQGRGLIVLVHATATPEWSNFVLSGFYPRFLKRVTAMSGLADKTQNFSPVLDAASVLDGWGASQTPDQSVRPLKRSETAGVEITPDHPPGVYGVGASRFPLNLGDTLPPLEILSSVPAAAKIETLDTTQNETRLARMFFLAALLLFLVDWLLMLSGTFRARFAVLVIAVLMATAPARADASADSAKTVHLACVKTDDAELCRSALKNLTSAMATRTAARMGEPVIVDLEKDDLSFYPLLYWPLDAATPLPEKARDALTVYLRRGGMLLADTRDGQFTAGDVAVTGGVAALRTALEGIAVPPLAPAPKNHVLFRAFYLLNRNPAYALDGKLWVEKRSIAPGDDISSVIVTGEDWLHRWAFPDADEKSEMGIRFGVNLTLYAMTGNYKEDQVHMRAILERMGP